MRDPPILDHLMASRAKLPCHLTSCPVPQIWVVIIKTFKTTSWQTHNLLTFTLMHMVIETRLQCRVHLQKNTLVDINIDMLKLIILMRIVSEAMALPHQTISMDNLHAQRLGDYFLAAVLVDSALLV